MISTIKQLNLSRRITDGTVLSSFMPKTYQGPRNFSGKLKKEDSSGSIYFPTFLSNRLQQASRSLVVRLPEPSALEAFKNTCSSCGEISNMYVFENNSENFVLVEMSDQNEVLEILKASEKEDKHSPHSLLPYQNEFGLYTNSQSKLIGSGDYPKVNQKGMNKIPLKAKSFKNVLNEVSQIKSINDKIIKVYDIMKMNELGIRLKFLLCRQLQRVVCGIMSDATVYPFGSSVCGFGVSGCDLDLVVVYNNAEREIISSPHINMDRPIMQAQLEVISDILRFFLHGYSNVVYIRHARVPIVKFKHWYTGIDCDLSMYCGTGVQMSQFLYTLGQLDERIRPLIFIVRLWASRVGITQDQPYSTISNFSLTLLVIFFLQQNSGLSLPKFGTFPQDNLFFSNDIVDSLLKSYDSGKEMKTKTVLELLKLFFKFYSSFDFKTAGCCVNTGRIIEKNDLSPLYIKNPLHPDLNVSRNVKASNLSKFQDMISVAAEYLERQYTHDTHSIFTDLFYQPFYVRVLKYAATEVRIGDVVKNVSPARKPQYSPHKYLAMGQLSQNTIKHLRWMLQKDILKQDIFLIGHPGPSRRHLAMTFLEMTRREVEYVSLSRDTTEADLKQRREISGGSARYFDQNAVRAAVEGRVLVLEGIEKAERNVLPVLNNLLENREMHLEDGRFLIPASRYDKLLKEHGKEELDKWKLVRVSDDFRVIALGLPVPRYSGNPLDPPLRSRFQARNVSPSTFHEQMAAMKEVASNADIEKISQLLSCGHALLSEESLNLGLPSFPVDNLSKLAFILHQFPSARTYDLLYRLYPYNILLQNEGKEALQHILKSFHINEQPTSGNALTEVKCSSNEYTATCTLSLNSANVQAQVACGLLSAGDAPEMYIPTPFQENLIAELLQSHSVSDFCLIGPRGCGKSATIHRLANLLNYEVEPIVLYQDITSRDLIQQRNTLPNGDTVWNNSPLIEAALSGKLAILDGIDQVHPSTLSVIHSLVHDRDVQLYDGKRLVRHDRFEEIKKKHNLSDEDMAKSQILKVHPSFRIVAIADSSKNRVKPAKWLSPEMLSLFLYHEMRALSYEEERHIIQKLFGSINQKVKKIIDFAAFLRSSDDLALASLSSSFSTRQLLRLSKRLSTYPMDSVYETLQKACLARFLPPMTKEAFENALQKVGIEFEKRIENENIACQITDKTVKIGNTEVSRYETKSKSKVPDILFYDIPQHLELLEWLIQDFSLGEHLLLVGNQGVGKNKIADRLLQLLNRPREYIQLHRDTTVQTLTLQPTIKDGVVSYEDSPLVQAVQLGHVLIIDEADKAPTQVTCILKTLVERNEMTLSDGRKIIPPGDKRRNNPNVIEVHPDFRIIVLANRPGFPFLGNDFFGALGDLFSCHAVDNPSTESEIALLKQYGPNVPESTILNLVKAFADLRDLADKGLVQYPYSTREVVNIVKHLQSFPEEGITDVVSNVFDFDKYSSNVLDTVIPVLRKHGIPVDVSPKQISLAREFPLPQASHHSNWNIKKPSVNSSESVTVRNIRVSDARKLTTLKAQLDTVEARGTFFTEMQSYSTLPLPSGSITLALATTRDKNSSVDMISIMAINPLRLYITSSTSPNVKIISLDSLFVKNSPGSRFRFSLSPLSDHLIGALLIHEENSNHVLLVDTYDNTVTQIDLAPVSDKTSKKFVLSPKWKINDQLSKNNIIILYTSIEGGIQVLNFNDMKTYSMQIPHQIKSLQVLSDENWLIQSYNKKNMLLTKKSITDPVPSVIREVSDTSEHDMGTIVGAFDFDLDDEVLSKLLNKKISSPNRLLMTNECHAVLAVGFPELESSDVFCWPRSKSLKHTATQGKSIFLKKSFQVVTPVNNVLAPDEVREQWPGSLGFLEVLDLKRRTLQYIAVPEGSKSWYNDNSTLGIFVDKISGDRLVTVDYNGSIRFWETGYLQLQRSLDDWQKMVGKEPGFLQVTIERPSGKDVSQPKHGEVDPHNKPHVGGNTWAGGTGGRDTAGLGGKGGPYRLDAGHDVHQIPDFEKDTVPEEVRQVAREIGQKTFRKRLKEIKMSEYDHDMYQSFYLPVAQQIKMLKVVIESVQAKSKEREWVRHQTSGDLDDLKLIEGLTGEKAIYRRRTKKEPDPGTPQTKPKRLKLVADVSGSMYRFNGYDGRLIRMLEASVLMMEAFEHQEAKFKYDITGHSGDGYNIKFVECENPPRNNKERLEVIKTMHAHSQFCMSGDHTIPATMHAIETVSKEDCDEAIVIVLSDANFERYGIRPSSFGRILTSNPEVNAYAILIGSLGDQATRFASTLPAGRAFVCMDLKDIPQIMRQIFTTSVLSSD